MEIKHARSWRTPFLLVLLLLSAHTALAWHGTQLHDHLAADECQVCLHLSAVKHGAGAATPLGIVPEFRAIALCELINADRLPKTVSPHYQSRAPPAI